MYTGYLINTCPHLVYILPCGFTLILIINKTDTEHWLDARFLIWHLKKKVVLMSPKCYQNVLRQFFTPGVTEKLAWSHVGVNYFKVFDEIMHIPSWPDGWMDRCTDWLWSLFSHSINLLVTFRIFYYFTMSFTTENLYNKLEILKIHTTITGLESIEESAEFSRVKSTTLLS